MKGREFKQWAERGCRIYGKDPWAFLRELAQNARDAGAGLITVDGGWDHQGNDVLVFHDDGCGMSMEHARRFLFRLYSSSKELQRTSAGQYGIGFWSVLRFEPDDLVIESATTEAAWAISADTEFQLQEIPCGLTSPGTRVTLRRRSQLSTEGEFVEALGDGLNRYCRHLRRNDRQASRLEVRFGGRTITRPLSLPGPLSLRFRHGAVEGVVGLAETPKVELLARGLPVWEGHLLDELSYRGAQLKWQGEIAEGLAPVFLLNGNDLDVVMSRNAVVDNAALGRVRKAARRALARLIKLHLHGTFPQSAPARFWAWLHSAAARFGPRLAALVVAAGVLAAAAVWGPTALRYLGRLAKPAPSADSAGHGTSMEDRAPKGEADIASQDDRAPPARPAGALSAPVATKLAPSAAAFGDQPVLPADAGVEGEGRVLGTIPRVYRGTLVDPPRAKAALLMAYTPEKDLLFKFITAEQFDDARGFSALAGTDHQDTNSEYRCQEDCVDVALEVTAGGPTVLPTPTGHSVDTQSLTVDAKGAQINGWDPAAQPVVRLAGPATVRYRTGFAPGELAEARRKALSTPAGFLPWPPVTLRSLRQLSPLPVAERVKGAVELTRDRLGYASSQEVADRYGALLAQNDWLPAVLAAGEGDCDVLNAVTVLMLREMNVPARLAIGVMGRAGNAVPGLHAWTEYFDNGWYPVDASVESGPDRIQGSSVAPGTRAAGPSVSEVRRPRYTVAPVDNIAPSSEDAPSGSDFDGWLLLVGGLVAAGVLAGTATRTKTVEKFAAAHDPGEAQELLAKIALNATAQPGAWRDAGAIWSHRILPRHRGLRLSLKSAFACGRAARLFSGGKEGGDLVQAAVNAGNIVLDADDPAFGPVARQIPGIIDLDRVAALEPLVREVGAYDEPDSLFAAANRLLAKAGAGDVRCILCPGLRALDYLDVNLETLKLPAAFPYPGRFIALRPDGKLASRCLAVFEDKPQLATYLLLEPLLAESVFFSRSSRIMRRKIAALLIREAT